MASLTVRRLDDSLKQLLRVRAAEHGRSMEEEVRLILRAALTGPEPPAALAEAIHARFRPLGGVELDLPSRDRLRPPPNFRLTRAWSCSTPTSSPN